MKPISVIVVLAILILVFIVINLFKGPSSKEVSDQVLVTPLKELSCIEACEGNEICIKECDTITINQAVLAKDLNKCDEITNTENRVSCIGKVSFSLAVSNKDISKCENIADLELKDLCNELAK